MPTNVHIEISHCWFFYIINICEMSTIFFCFTYECDTLTSGTGPCVIGAINLCLIFSLMHIRIIGYL